MKFNKHGIAVILKEKSLVSQLSVAEINIMVNIERLGILSKMLGRDEEPYLRTFTTAS